MPLRIRELHTSPASSWHRVLTSHQCWFTHGKICVILCKLQTLLTMIQAQQQRSVRVVKGGPDRISGWSGQSCRHHLRCDFQGRIRTVVLAYLGRDELVQRSLHLWSPWYELLDETRECEEEQGARARSEGRRCGHEHVGGRRKLAGLALFCISTSVES